MRNWKTVVKERMLDRLHVPHNKNGLPACLLKYLEVDRPLRLIDVGAHDGTFTSSIESYCGISEALLIEVLPQKIRLLKNRFLPPRYQVFECALSATEGTADFELNEYEPASSLLSMRRDLRELSVVSFGQPKIMQCRTRTLDSVVAESGLNEVDLLKIDVQGAEHLVLDGATATLSRTSMVWIEVSFRTLYERSSSFQDIYSYLTQANFRLYELEPGFRSPQGELLQADALFMISKAA